MTRNFDFLFHNRFLLKTSEIHISNVQLLSCCYQLFLPLTWPGITLSFSFLSAPVTFLSSKCCGLMRKYFILEVYKTCVFLQDNLILYSWGFLCVCVCLNFHCHQETYHAATQSHLSPSSTHNRVHTLPMFD